MSESHQIQKPRSLGGFDSTGLAGIDPVHRRVCVAVPVGKFASSAYQALVNLEDLKIQVAERERAEAELRELTESPGVIRAFIGSRDDGNSFLMRLASLLE